MKFQIEKEDIRDCITVINDWMGLRFSEKQMRDLLEKNPKICAEIFELGAFDTCCRENLMSAVGKYLVGRKCPIGADGEEVSAKFYKDIEKAAIKLGIKVI